QSPCHRLGEMSERVARPYAFHVRTGGNRFCRSMHGIGGHFMTGIKISDGAAIRNDEVFEAPIVPEDGLQEPVASATGFVVYPLIRAHHFADVCIAYQRFEGGQIGFPQVVGTHVGYIQYMPAPLGPECTSKCLAQARSLRY